MFHTVDESDESVTQSIDPDCNPQIVESNHSQHSVLVCADICPEIQDLLSSRFTVTRHLSEHQYSSFDAYITDCRGAAISITEKFGLINSEIVLALVDEHSFLPAESSDQDAKLELITEAELGSEILHLRITSRLRSIQPDTTPTNPDKDIVRENAYEILQTFIQHSTDWMVVKDLDHRFALVTDRFLQSHHKDANEVIGKNDLEIGTSKELVLGTSDTDWDGYWASDDRVIASKLPDQFDQMIIRESALEQAREHVSRVPMKNKDGDVFALFVCVTQAYTSNINGDTVSTLTSRRNIDLSPIIKQLDDDKNRAEAQNLESQFAIKRKNNFIATASHDLRQPMHAIGLFIEALHKTMVDSDQKEILSKMKQSSNDLNDLLNSILDISKLDAEAVPVNKSHFAITPLLRSIEDEFETEATAKSIQLHINSSNSVVHTDSLLLSRILKNLVNNAVKYTSSGSVNLITEVDESYLTIRVKDTGPGIPKEQYQSVFIEYHQLANQQAQSNFGQGLGLSIVKRLVDLLKLDISLDSEIGHGTQFTLRVPLGDSLRTQKLDHPVRSLTAVDPYKLMVIEDNETILDAMNEMLTGMGCDVYPALDIPEALEIISELEELPNLLIVDYQLADGVTGDLAIEQICTTAEKEIPAIIVTGNNSSALVRTATASAFRVLSKPVNPDALLRTISSAINETQGQPSRLASQ